MTKIWNIYILLMYLDKIHIEYQNTLSKCLTLR